MKIKFYVINHDSQLYKCRIAFENKADSALVAHKSSRSRMEIFTVDSYFFHLFLTEIQCCETYRLCLARYIKSLPSYTIKLEPPRKEYIDKVW